VRRRGSGRGPALPLLALNMTAMIDVVFLLLVYFMLIAQFRDAEASLPVDAPAGEREASSSFELPALAVEIEVETRGGVLVVRSSEASLAGAEDLKGLIARARASLASDRAFILRAAPDARWEHAVEVLDGLRAAGYDRVDLAEPITP